MWTGARQIVANIGLGAELKAEVEMKGMTREETWLEI